MKKAVLLGILCFSLLQTFACDICGCSSGNYFIGLLPQFRKHFIGTRYTFRSYTSHVAGDASQFSHDFYQTVELWGGMNVGRKWQVMAFVPYNINKQNSDDGLNHSSGLGDITVIGNYKLLDTRTGTKKGDWLSQQLFIGGGVKLPTGKFAADPEDIIPDANNQPGTGSVDFLADALYSIHVGDWGVNSSVSYKINESAEDFHFGNRFNASAFAFHSFTGLKTTLNPNVGLLYERLDANKLKNEKVADTGGQALLAAAGLEMNIAKVAFGVNAQLPIAQNLSNGQTHNKVRGMAHVTLLF